MPVDQDMLRAVAAALGAGQDEFDDATEEIESRSRAHLRLIHSPPPE